MNNYDFIIFKHIITFNKFSYGLRDMNKERRLNLILYLSKDWKEEWNEQTKLWDNNMTYCVKKSPVVF